ncbi:MAG: hypothetical protein M1504_02870 [Candidatus Marsarchaeota archaeon]|nr:hypothetical protein [Candidatus Marsarchaeota archaeon]
MREFLLYSRTGRTDANFKNLVDGGRLDIVYQCTLMAIFKSAAHRHDAVFHAILNGAPNPPLKLSINGNDLRDARIDERSWESILRNVLSGGAHPGIETAKISLQRFIEDKHREGYKIYVLSDEGEPIASQDLSGDILFVIGDHVGLPKKDEGFVLRYGKAVSLGREKYLAASCIDIVNYTLDTKV